MPELMIMLENESIEAYLKRREVEVTNAGEKWFTPKKCRFIEPGLVRYANMGEKGEDATLLITKPTLDKMAKSFIGKPVVNTMHRKVSPSDYTLGKADGIVTNVYYNAADGWFWADFIPFNIETERNCENGNFFVSCAYQPRAPYGNGGEYHNISYDGEILDGEYTHLAIVANPRYEGAFITNSKEGGLNMFKFWKKGKDAEGKEVLNAGELAEDATVEVGGKKVALKDLVGLYNTANPEPINEDSEIELANGKKVSVKELKALAEKQNAADEDEAKKKKAKDDEEKENSLAHEKGEHKNRLENCALCNSEDEKEKKKKEDEEKENGKEHFKDLKNARSEGGTVETPRILMDKDEFARGKSRYGSADSK